MSLTRMLRKLLTRSGLPGVSRMTVGLGGSAIRPLHWLVSPAKAGLQPMLVGSRVAVRHHACNEPSHSCRVILYMTHSRPSSVSEPAGIQPAFTEDRPHRRVSGIGRR